MACPGEPHEDVLGLRWWCSSSTCLTAFDVAGGKLTHQQRFFKCMCNFG
jgi:hypothetical protein